MVVEKAVADGLGLDIDVYCKEENSEKRIKTKKRPVVAPGEMEEILLGREELLKYPDLQQLIITVKEG